MADPIQVIVTVDGPKTIVTSSVTPSSIDVTDVGSGHTHSNLSDLNNYMGTLLDNSFEDRLFVATTGDDSNPGTEAEPFLTITAARDAIRLLTLTKPMVVYIRDGVYRIASTILLESQDSGTQDYPITYKAYPDEDVILSGSKVVTGNWVDEGGDLWSLSLPGQAKFRHLIVNGQRATTARWPSEGTYHVMEAFPGVTSPEVSDYFYFDSTELTPDGLSGRPLILAQEEVEIVLYNDFVVLRHLFDRYGTTPADDTAVGDGDEKVYFDVSTPTGPDSPVNSNSHYARYFWENSLSFLTDAGEWFWDDTNEKLYYHIRAGEVMTAATVEVGVVESLIDVRGDLATLPAQTGTFSVSMFFKTNYSDTGITDPTHGVLYWEKSLINNQLPTGLGYSIGLVQKNAPTQVVGFIEVDYGGTIIDATGVSGLNDDLWHHVVVVFTPGTDIKIYVDGTESTYNGSNSIGTPTIISAPPYIGTQGGLPWSSAALFSSYWDGEIDDVVITETALTGTNVTELSTKNYTNINTDIVFHMPLDNNFEFNSLSIQGIEHRQLWFHTTLDIAFHSHPLFVTDTAPHEFSLSFDGLSDHLRFTDGSGLGMAGTFIEYLNFEDITFTGTDRAAVLTDGWAFDGQDYNTNIQAALTMQFARYTEIDNCTFTNLNGSAVFIDNCNHTQTCNNRIYNIGGEGISILGYRHRLSEVLTGQHKVSGNLVYDVGWMLKNGNGMVFTVVGDLQIVDNYVHSCYRGGIKINNYLNGLDKGRGNIEIARNMVRNCCLEISDLGGIMVNGGARNSRVHHNHIKDMLWIAATHGIRRTDDSTGKLNQVRGLYLDVGTAHWVIDHNLVYRASSEVFFTHKAGPDNIYENNIFVDPLQPGSACWSNNMANDTYGWDEATETKLIVEAVDNIAHRNIYYSRAGNTCIRLDISGNEGCTQDLELRTGIYSPMGDHDYNLFYQDIVSYLPTGTDPATNTTVHDLAWLQTNYNIESNSVVGDPQFLDYKNDNFHVASTSPAIALGFENFDVPQFEDWK